MKSDAEIRGDVESELRFRPEIDARDIAIKVNEAVVALSGFTRTYLDKQRAEEAAKRVAGVAGIANDIEVRPGGGDERTDPEIARAAVQAIRAELPAANESIKVLVHHGHVRLEGTVEWHYLKASAERAVRRLRSVTGITNWISIAPSARPADIRQRIEEALRRSAQIDARGITVEAHGGEVTLHGTVHSWSAHDEAQQTAWSAPGVTRVNNEITVGRA